MREYVGYTLAGRPFNSHFSGSSRYLFDISVYTSTEETEIRVGSLKRIIPIAWKRWKEYVYFFLVLFGPNFKQNVAHGKLVQAHLSDFILLAN
jgi:hypothetical protein